MQTTLYSSLLFSAIKLGASVYIGAGAILLVIILLMFIIVLSSRYMRCPSNRILVIYGRGSTSQSAICIHGGAKFVYPLLQDYDYLSLEPMQIEIPLRGALSMENIRVNVPSVFSIAIGTTPEQMQNAAIRLLGLSKQEISKQAEDIIFGQLRQVIASMHIEEINRDRESFLSNIQMSLEPELRKLGLILINVNVTDITDESGYIEAIGRKAASEAIQKARGDVADNERMGETRVAEAEQLKAIQVANAVKLKEIGTREAEREKIVRTSEINQEQAVRLADLEKIKIVGEQAANFKKEAEVKQAERDMRIQLADANATAVQGENKAQAIIADSDAELQVRRADAYQTGESKKRQAEGAVLEAEHLAQAQAALAQAQRIEAERRAAVEAPAKAEKARTIVEAEAVAERQRIEAEGEAKAIFAKLEAEARGQYEILAKKGEGLREIISACGGAKEAFQMLMLEHFDELVAASAQAISNIKFDKVVVWDGGQNAAGGGSATSNWLHQLTKTLPPMFQVMKDVGGIEIPEILAKLEGADNVAPGADTGKSQANSSDTFKNGADEPAASPVK